MKRLLTLILATLTIAVALAAGPDADAVLAKMRELTKGQNWKELIAQFKDEDLAAWKDAPAKAAEAAKLRAKAYVALKDGAQAERELKFAIEQAPKNGEHWHDLGMLYSGLLANEALALDAYWQGLCERGQVLRLAADQRHDQ
jgi:tetratricopeptide (TPR) repeat protein